MQRSQLLPEGGGRPPFGSLVPRLRRVLDKAAEPHSYERDPESIAAWAAVYPELSTDWAGITGALCARGDSHALRLQILYAALEGPDEIGSEHVLAALEVIRYAHDSVRYIFGDKTGDETAVRILEALRTEGEKTRSGLFLVFNGNVTSSRLQPALDLLLEHGYAYREGRAPKGGGLKTVEVWMPTGE